MQDQCIAKTRHLHKPLLIGRIIRLARVAGTRGSLPCLGHCLCHSVKPAHMLSWTGKPEPFLESHDEAISNRALVVPSGNVLVTLFRRIQSISPWVAWRHNKYSLVV